MECYPETCDLVKRNIIEREKRLIEFFKHIEPCDGFVHKHSCGVDCLHYQCVVFGGQNWHYCCGKRMNMHALKFIKIVGCYTYEDKNGDNK